MKRRTLLASLSAAATATGGCLSGGSSPQPAHTVTVYLGEREATRNVTVTVKNQDGETLFEQDYNLSDSNEADEDATFPESTEPENVVVTVDGNRFEEQWPGFENPELPCEGENWAGIEVWVEGNPGETPSVRMETNCQHVTMDEEQTE